MKTPERKINEVRISGKHDKAVNDVCNRMVVINETVVSLENYRRRVDCLRFQLVETWCLCKWCQLFNPECENYLFWITELKDCIDKLKLPDIKNNVNKRKTLVRLLVSDYDYNSVNMIERIIRDKFNQGNINNIFQKIRVCAEFADNINSLIDVISMKTVDVEEYLQNTFKMNAKENM